MSAQKAAITIFATLENFLKFKHDIKSKCILGTSLNYTGVCEDIALDEYISMGKSQTYFYCPNIASILILFDSLQNTLKSQTFAYGKEVKNTVDVLR